MATKDNNKVTAVEPLSEALTETTPAATEAVTLDEFSAKFGRGGAHTAYIKARAAKVNKIEEVDSFLDEFANNRHKRGEMRKQLIELGGIKEGENNGNSN